MKTDSERDLAPQSNSAEECTPGSACAPAPANSCDTSCETTSAGSCDESMPLGCCAIEAEGVEVLYGKKKVLTDVSFGMAPGKITAIIGPSGCGKSTFLSTLNRMSDLTAGCSVSGEIRLEGKSILGPSVDLIELRRRVGMIFQKPNPFPLSIRKNIQLPLREMGIRDRDELEATTEKVIRDVGLWDEVSDRLDASALALSGGQQQRLCIARAMALDPDVLLFDEPCSALDPISCTVVEELIASLRKQYTVVIVTHNMSQARRIADSVAVFWVQEGSGKMIEFGDLEKVFEDPKHDIVKDYVQGGCG